MHNFRKGFFSSTIRNSFKMNIHFITDTEGHLSSFIHSIKESRVVRLDHEDRLHFHSDIKDPYFIFGGDLTDRGTGDTKLTEMLLDFKQRNQDRVILLVGNREASKTRFLVELNPRYIRERLVRGGAPFWLTSGPHQLPVDYVKKHMELSQKAVNNLTDIEQHVESLDIEECQLIYLKWMLEQNLGCPHTFEYHRQQLAEKLDCKVMDISDSMILKSIMEQTSPTGIVGEYIKQTQIAALIPEAGILAVHGGLTPENIGRLPAMLPTDPPIRDLQTWITQFNSWYKAEVAKWANLKHDEQTLELQPARSTLDTFSIRVPSEYRSIVTASMLDHQRRFAEVPDFVSDYLRDNKIKLVLSGHQPCGDYPALLRSKDDQVIFINGDTSYANSKAGDVHNARGHANHTLQVLVNDHRHLQININARLATGKLLENCLEIIDDKVADNSYIGKMLPGNELVQCLLEEPDYYRTIYQEGFKVVYKFRTKLEIEDLLQTNSIIPTLEYA